jgi:hypothetical protein
MKKLNNNLKGGIKIKLSEISLFTNIFSDSDERRNSIEKEYDIFSLQKIINKDSTPEIREAARRRIHELTINKIIHFTR